MISRFYCPMPLQAGRTVTLPPEAAHHALRVLRLRKDDELLVFNGQGGEYPGKVTETSPLFRLMLTDWHDIEREAPLALTLAQALPSGDKMDWVVQKAVELGVRAIQPLQAKRSVVRLSGERAEKRRGHWQQVAIAACEQSGRNRVPTIGPVLDLPHYLPQPAGENETRLLLSPQAEQRLSALPRPVGGLTLLVGPEGGFDADEEAAACSVGFRPVTLGPRVLRTETAGLAAIAAILALWGDF
ncbi:MAG: 16S rRNA (uracil(1498)-N(3))-methyltransferase [Betaproteobacteria bacterium]|nr:16S rRNA (uracil(1498)-N(3))-methyltransferase [Betaproteobacteria bacterium]